MDEPKKMAQSDAWETIKLCHLVNITLKDSNKLDWIKKGKVCYWEQTLPAVVVVVSSKKTSPKAGGPLLCGPNKKGKVCYWEQTLPNGNFSNTQKNNTNKKGTSPKGRGTTPPRTKQKRQSLLSEREQTLPFQPKSLDDLSSWQDKSSSQKGWVSIDRSMVAALPSTTPRPAHKSSTDDLGPPLCQVNEAEKLLGAFDQEAKFPRSGRSPKTIVPRARTEAQRYRCHD